MKFKKIKPNNLLPLIKDTVPFELPLAFNMNLFYGVLVYLELEWVSKNKVRINRKKSKRYREFLKIILGAEPSAEGKYLYYKLNGQVGYSPYKYYSEYKSGKNRELHLMHPVSLLRSAEFIYKNSNMIIYHTNRSNFSVRKPIRVAKLHSLPPKLNINEDINFLESDVESPSMISQYIRSYFVYNPIESNYFQFFESKKFRTIEKNYNLHYQLDISNCFASIYTHSISWATNGWHSSKRTFSSPEKKDDLAHTFGNQFDSLQQKINHKETNGILVGPEVSRLFAEIILQRIDLNIEKDLESIGILNNKDYSIYRFVDDYHIFVQDTSQLSIIKRVIESNLSVYKLRINDAKERCQVLGKENIYTTAKNRITRSITDNFYVEDGIPRINYESASNDFQSALKDLDKSEKYINYAFGIIQNQISSHFYPFIKSQEDFFESSNSKSKLYYSNSRFFDYCESTIKLSLLLYKSSPTYSHSLKFVYIVASIFDAISNSEIPDNFRVHQLRSWVREEIINILLNQDKSDLQVQDLNLIDILTHLKLEMNDSEINLILKKSSKHWDSLDMFEIVVLFRHFNTFNRIKEMNKIIRRVREIVAQDDSPEFMTSSIFLKIIFYKVLKHMGNGSRELTSSDFSDWDRDNPIFDSEIDKYYLHRLASKRHQIVY